MWVSLTLISRKSLIVLIIKCLFSLHYSVGSFITSYDVYCGTGVALNGSLECNIFIYIIIKNKNIMNINQFFK